MSIMSTNNQARLKIKKLLYFFEFVSPSLLFYIFIPLPPTFTKSGGSR